MVKNTLTSLINASFPVRLLVSTMFVAVITVLEKGIMNNSANLAFFYMSLLDGVGLGVMALFLGFLLALVFGKMQKGVPSKS